MPRPPIRRTRPVTPVRITRTTRAFIGFTVMSDDDDNVTITAHWLDPQKDGTIVLTTNGVDADPIRDLSGFEAIVDAIADVE